MPDRLYLDEMQKQVRLAMGLYVPGGNEERIRRGELGMMTSVVHSEIKRLTNRTIENEVRRLMKMWVSELAACTLWDARTGTLIGIGANCLQQVGEDALVTLYAWLPETKCSTKSDMSETVNPSGSAKNSIGTQSKRQ